MNNKKMFMLRDAAKVCSIFSSIIFILASTLTVQFAVAATKNAITQPKVVAGDNVYSILKRQGFNDNQRQDALSQSTIPGDFVVSPGDLYRVTKNVDGSVEVLFFAKNSNDGFTFWRSRAGLSSGKKISLKYDVQTLTSSGKVKGSLIESVAQTIGDELMAYRFMDAFLLDYNLVKDLQKNARFELVYEKLYNLGLFVRFGEVRKAQLEINGETVTRLYRELKTGGGIFYDPNVNLSSRRFFAPVDNIRISSLFQMHRFHPIKKFRRAHTGVDFAMPEGSPVYAVSEGIVMRTGRNHAAGRFVVLRHRDGLETFYDHLSVIKPLVPGQNVLAGTILGQIGCSGYCTKPHLHFAVKRDGQFINPIYMIRNYSFTQRQEVMNLVAQNKK